MLHPIGLIALIIFLAGCSALEETDETKAWSQQQLFIEAGDQLRAGNYDRAIRYYEILESRYPYGKHIPQTQLNVAYAYYRFNEPESALAAADRFIKFHPQHPAVAYAYYLKGMANFDRREGVFDFLVPTDVSQRDPGSTLDAYRNFEMIVTQYADSDYAQDARKRMLFLRNNLARYEIHVARYYMKRGAFLAAANRANYVVQNYQRTPSLASALQIMIDAYGHLGLTTLAEDAQRVLDANRNTAALVEDPLQKLENPTWIEGIWQYFNLDLN